MKSNTPETDSIKWQDNEWDLKARFEKFERERNELKKVLTNLYKLYYDFIDSDKQFADAYYSFYKNAYGEWQDAYEILEKLNDDS